MSRREAGAFESHGEAGDQPVTLHATKVDKTSRVGTWLSSLGVETMKTCSVADDGCVSRPYDGDLPDNVGGGTIGDTGARTRTGVSVVAILREGSAHPAPGPEAELRAGDTLVVVGTPRGIEELAVLLRSG